ncbi:periplakin isoform X2 [Hemicordylus capensis]|uniref:periplakin isoform X2 n=1 Tax=Hemicordylus capensis TaxID=884348 RepID=UPI0023042625|nr:periplakin isoform X2 [Hemicordylus capensis]
MPESQAALTTSTRIQGDTMHSLFKRRNKGKYSPTVQKKSISNKELSELIVKLQKNADQVEKNIVEADTKMQNDLHKIKAGQPEQYKDHTADKLIESDKILYVLDGDAAIARHMKHPQGDMITEDIRQLKERVANLRVKHDQIYNFTPQDVEPQVDWVEVIEEKLETLNGKGFGTDLPSVNGQVEEHNIFHNEVMAIGPHISKHGDKEYMSGIQVKYQKLLAASQQRQQDLNSLQDYMQRCTNKLYWLDQQAKDRMQYDWSDRNLDYPSRRRQYENFINRKLEEREEAVNKLHIDGDLLLAENHPGKIPIEAHIEAVHADWKEYLNLLICEESHLKFMEDYHQFQKDAKDAQDLLRKVDTDLDQKYSPDFKDRYQIESLLRELEDQEKAWDKYDDVVKSLQKRSQQVLPLKFRRETPLKPIPVEALCDYENEQSQVNRGATYTLHKNSGDIWELTDSAGNMINAPGVCFMIPPTDPESLNHADNIADQYQSVKQKTAGTKNLLQQRYDGLKADSIGDAASIQGRQLLAGLEKVNTELEKQEKAITANLRPPLEQNRAVQDSAERSKDLKNITNEIRRIEPEKARKIQECEAFIESVPDTGSATLVKNKAEETNNKYNHVVQLLSAAQEKVDVANRLENSLQQGRELLSGYENKLAIEDTIPEDVRALDRKREELQALGSELKAQRPLLTEAEQGLQKAKKCSSALASQFQEHCPDIERQEAELHKLNQRFGNLNKQIDHRSQVLQKAKSAYSNYRSGYDSLSQFLRNVPNYEPLETDNVGQVEKKLQNQRALLGEIASMDQDVQEVAAEAQLYQQAVKDYELEAEKLRSILDLENGRNGFMNKRPRLQSPAAKVKEEEAILAAKFTEVNAVNRQRLQNLEFAQSLLRQQPEVHVTQESVQTSRSERPLEELWKLKKELDDESQSRQQLEAEIKVIQDNILLLQKQRPQETVVRKEVVKNVPDPQLDENFHKMQQNLAEEQRKNQALQDELAALKFKLRVLEHEKREGGQEYVVKEVLRIEPDKAQAEEILKLKEELEELKRQEGTRENEMGLLRRQVTALSNEKNKEQEKVTEKEVLKLQNDPQLEAEYQLLQENKQKESSLRHQQEEELRFLQEKLKRLEKERAMAEGKITVKEVLKVEKDLATEREVIELRRQYEEEKAKGRSSEREKAELLRKIQALEEENAKVIIQEKVREIVRPDPTAENEVANLRLELVEQQRRYRGGEEELRSCQNELASLRNRGPQVEVQEIIKEVIKYKTDPETEMELQHLRNDIVDRTRAIERADLEIYQLKQEIQTLKDAKPQVQVKEVVQEVLQYREDPQTRKEVESLKTQLAEEQKKHLDLERERELQEEKIRQKEEELSQVKEKVVQQEVVKLEQDPALKAEVSSFSQSIENELQQIDSLRDEMRKLQRRRSELERQLDELEKERQARREAELEVQRLKIRLSELEQQEKDTTERVTVKQKVILQQDPQQEKEHALLKLELEEEKHRRQVLQAELEALCKKLQVLEKMEVKEKVVFSESVQVEKGDTEYEIQKLKNNLEEESRRKMELDADINRLEAKLSEVEFNNSKSSKELDFLREENHKLHLEKQNLLLETRRLQSEIELTVTEARDLRNMSQVDSGVNLDSRFQSLERELEDLKRLSHEKDGEIEQLQTRLQTVAIKREQRENHLRRSIVVIDPDTGKEMSPEEAHTLGLIEWNLYVKLKSQECDWEEISMKGPTGESSVILDRKSGRKFSIEDALKSGRLTTAQYNSYLNKEISIQELAVLVSGQK